MVMHMTKQEFRQEPHCCAPADADPIISLDLVDGGGGEYVVMNASEWAFENPFEVDDLCARIKQLIISAKTEKP